MAESYKLDYPAPSTSQDAPLMRFAHRYARQHVNLRLSHHRSTFMYSFFGWICATGSWIKAEAAAAVWKQLELRMMCEACPDDPGERVYGELPFELLRLISCACARTSAYFRLITLTPVGGDGTNNAAMKNRFLGLRHRAPHPSTQEAKDNRSSCRYDRTVIIDCLAFCLLL